MGAIASRRARVEPSGPVAEPAAAYVSKKPAPNLRLNLQAVTTPTATPASSLATGQPAALQSLQQKVARFLREHEPSKAPDESARVQAWHTQYSATEGYRLLLGAGLSLPSLAALVQHDEFAHDPERFAPALLGLALCELADRGALTPSPANGVMGGDLAALDFTVTAVRSVRVRSPLLNDVLRFVRAAGGACSSSALCREFVQARDIGAVHPGRAAGSSRISWGVAAELESAGFKRTLRAAVSAPRVLPRSSTMAGRMQAEGPAVRVPSSHSLGSAPVHHRAASLDGSTTLELPFREALKRPTAPATDEGRAAAVATVVFARAVHEAERHGRALSSLSDRELEAFVTTEPGAAGEPAAVAEAKGALVLLALSEEQRGRVGRRGGRRGPRANACRPLPGLGREALGLDELLTRVAVVLRGSAQLPWGGELCWQSAFGFDFYPDTPLMEGYEDHG